MTMETKLCIDCCDKEQSCTPYTESQVISSFLSHNMNNHHCASIKQSTKMRQKYIQIEGLGNLLPKCDKLLTNHSARQR